MAGTRPICEVEFASFFYCAFDQVCNQAAKLRYMSGGQASMPITFRCVNGAVGGAAAQHSETVYAQFLSVPGLKLVVPSGPCDMKGLLKSAIRDNNPVIVFEHGGLGRLKEQVPDGEHLVPLGKAAIKREGQHVTVIAIGAMVSRALKVAAKLAGEGVSVEVLDPRTLVPLDEEAILTSVAKTNRVVIADEGHLRGGAAADIAALIAEKAFDSLDAPIKRVAAPDVPIPFSPPLEKAVIPGEAQIEAGIRAVLGI
jgi:pyruvate dehydrogenase E1 component beta subunit